MALKAKLTGGESLPAPRAPRDAGAQNAPAAFDESSIPALARGAVETYVSRGLVIEPTIATRASLLTRPSACFVCIKTLERELRGCVGTVEPEKETLGAEVVANAIKAATRDPRFRPLSQNELASLCYSVDVLGAFEPTRFEDLDPTLFGLMVVGQRGSRRGLLLPNIEGIRTADVQIRVAAGKAGIQPDEPLRLYRFRTRRFSEWD